METQILNYIAVCEHHEDHTVISALKFPSLKKKRKKNVFAILQKKEEYDFSWAKHGNISILLFIPSELYWNSP